MDNKRNYIVYQITNKINSNIYIGIHITKNIKDGYMGSGTNIDKAIKEFGKENFEKIVLWNFDNKNDMLLKEHELVNDIFVNRKDTYNVILGGGGISTLGLVVVKDKFGNKFTVSVKDKRYLSGELIHISKGMVAVKDEDGNTFSVSIDNPKFLNGEYQGVSVGMVPVKDKDGNTFSVSVKDERYILGELESIWLNRKHTEKSKKKIGDANRISQLGEKNSNYGKCWIFNEKIKKSKTIKKEELDKYLLGGWKKGRKIIFG
jgi:hypothetical protein